MARCSYLTGRSLGSVFGLTRQEEAPGSLMTMSAMRVCRPNGVSCGSGLKGRNVGDPEEPEQELDDEDDVVSIRLGVQELPRRRDKAGGGGYSYLGGMPPSMCSRTASKVRPGMPHHWRRPSELWWPRGSTLLAAASWSA
ncbi:hypothetical protein D1007_03101 [Hordeum vulgare]|nr:hypothetical protein D1007_03101 [Hordeum vulgare]